MRSRYTAFVRRDQAYLLRTWDPSHRPQTLELDDTNWLGLEVVSREAGGADDAEGIVSFAATYENADGSVATMRETSRFARVDGDWVYVDGKSPQ